MAGLGVGVFCVRYFQHVRVLGLLAIIAAFPDVGTESVCVSVCALDRVPAADPLSTWCHWHIFCTGSVGVSASTVNAPEDDVAGCGRMECGIDDIAGRHSRASSRCGQVAAPTELQ